MERALGQPKQAPTPRERRMAEFEHVTLLYTANLQGELTLLPRLFTLIQQERRAATGPTLLLDLGDSCALSAWVCQATHGRAPFLVLDSMGYDAALIGGPERVPIPPSALRRLVAEGLDEHEAKRPRGRQRAELAAALASVHRNGGYASDAAGCTSRARRRPLA